MADDVPPPTLVSPHELMRRQAIIDECWQRTLMERQHRREEAERRAFNRQVAVVERGCPARIRGCLQS